MWRYDFPPAYFLYRKSHCRQETQEIFPPLLRALVHTGILKHAGKDMTDLIAQNLIDIFFCDRFIFREEFLNPVCMFFNALIAPDIFLLDDVLREKCKLIFQS